MQAAGPPRQKHAGLALGQGRGHHEVFRGQFQPHVLHHLDVLDVLSRDVRDGYIEDVEVLSPYQVEEQVERPLEGLEDDLERIGWNVEILGRRHPGLALHDGEGHLLLFGTVEFHQR